MSQGFLYKCVVRNFGRTLVFCMVVFGLTWILSPVVAQTSGVKFSQIDFAFTNASVNDSDWGRIEVNVSNFPAEWGLNEGYLNLYTDGGWVIQNMLIDNRSGTDSIVMYFNLSVQVGVNVTSLYAYLNFTPEPFINFMDGPRSNYSVYTEIYNAEGVGPSTTVIPTPMPPLEFNATGETYNFTKPNRSGENVQTAHNQCFPMAIANSLQYLENRYGIPVPHDHKIGLKGDNSLVGQLDTACDRGVINRTNGFGVWFVPMLDGKFKYLNANGLGNKLIHRHQGYGWGGAGNQLPQPDFTRHGITSKDESVGGKVTFEWICEQVKKCEDVEVVFSYDSATGEPTGGHAVRVFGCGKTKGQPWLRYKHDRLQTNNDPTDTQGLEEPEVFVQDLDGDGMPNFGAPDKEIRFALSESPKPESKPVPSFTPIGILILIILVLLFGIVSIKKRYQPI